MKVDVEGLVMEFFGAFWLWWKVVVDEDLWWLKVEGVCYGGGCGGGKLVRVKEVVEEVS
jgi:hypothetical protein